MFCYLLYPLPDLLVKKSLFRTSILFSEFQSGANCPDVSIFKQSKQNWARLWSTIKRPLSICFSEHAPMKGYTPSFPPINLQRNHSTARGKEDQCPASASSGKRIELFTANCAAFTVWYTTQTGLPHVCKRVFRFICFEPPPGCSFWQLLSHREEQMINSCGFNVILHKVAVCWMSL